MKTFCVVNPASSGGCTGRLWPRILRQLEQAIGPVQSELTTRNFAAVAITQRALQAGYDRIIAVGGDGTVSEVAIGFQLDRAPINREAVLGFLMAGTGSDLGRTFRIETGIVAQLARLASGRTREIDLGRVNCVDEHGNPNERLFINIASFGLSGAVALRVNRATFSKVLGGRLSFRWNSALATFGYRNLPARLRVDDAFDDIVDVSTVAVANGQYFGGGMWVAPKADPADGLFDVVIMRGVSRTELLRELGKIYAGKHLDNPKVTVVRGKKITAEPVAHPGVEAVLLEVDGESPGRLPASFEILPQAIRVAC